MIASPTKEQAAPMAAEKVGSYGIQELTSILSRPLPPAKIKLRDIPGGGRVKFIPWVEIVKILDKYAPGWEWEITGMQTSDYRIYVIGKLTLVTSEGSVSRSASGTEMLNRMNKEGEIKEIAYGNPSSNAEANAFRRAAEKFGLGLHLKVKS